ncbi:MAG: hypothetical protein DRJ52_10545 [Thermoprotei archaeon]|nr:MAG: hypothetical protein DRJ52_10545 [Thermoprotei archaeon]
MLALNNHYLLYFILQEIFHITTRAQVYGIFISEFYNNFTVNTLTQGISLISVIVPTKDNEKTIGALLESLRKQEYRDFEVIIVDSSSDSTPLIASKYTFTKLLKIPPVGANAARNLGVKNAKGEIIVFTDGDCRVPPDWLKKILEFFEKNKTVDVVGGSVYTAKELRGNLIADYYNEALWPMMPIYPSEAKVTKENFHKIRVPNSNNLAFRRRVFDEGFLFNEEFKGGYEETELLWRLCLRGYDIRVFPKIVVEHFHTKSLRNLLRRAFSYGRGHYLFYLKYRDCPLAFYGMLSAIAICLFDILLILATLANWWHVFLVIPLAYSVLVALYFRKIRRLRSLTYPLLDFIFYTVMALGVFKGVVDYSILHRS